MFLQIWQLWHNSTDIVLGRETEFFLGTKLFPFQAVERLCWLPLVCRSFWLPPEQWFSKVLKWWESQIHLSAFWLPGCSWIHWWQQYFWHFLLKREFSTSHKVFLLLFFLPNLRKISSDIFVCLHPDGFFLGFSTQPVTWSGKTTLVIHLSMRNTSLFSMKEIVK